MAAGPLVGGLLIDTLGWRSIFLVNVPIGLTGLAMTARVARGPTLTEARSLDLAGQACAVLALGGVTACLIEGPSLGWLSGLILGSVAASLGVGAAFLAIEAQAERPMLPLGLFRNGRFAGSVFVSMVSAFAFYGLLFIFSLLFQRQRGWEPLRAGLAFLPLTALVSMGSLISRQAALLLGPRVLVSDAFLLFAFGFLGLFAMGATAPYAWLALPLPMIGLAASLVTHATTVAAMGTVGRSRAGIAAGVLNAARQTGAALGVAASGALLAASPSFEDGMRADIVLSTALPRSPTGRAGCCSSGRALLCRTAPRSSSTGCPVPTRRALPGWRTRPTSTGGKLLAGAALSTLLGVGAELGSQQGGLGGTGQQTVVVATSRSAEDSLNQVGQQITRRNLNVQPTLTVRPGFLVRVIVNKDIVLRPYGTTKAEVQKP